jgi:hypothetical protein
MAIQVEDSGWLKALGCESSTRQGGWLKYGCQSERTRATGEQGDEPAG